MTRRAGATELLNAMLGRGTSLGLTDGELVERFSAGGGEAAEAAFATLVERHSRMVYRTCRSILRDDHEALDASQATFLILFRRGGSLRVAGSLGPWLHRVAYRAAQRSRREAGRRRAVERQLLTVRRPGPAAGDADSLAGIVHEELDRLPEQFRAAVILCDLEGRTTAAAADQLGCPVGTVASRLARGRDRLRRRLARRGLDPAAPALAFSCPRELTAIPPLVAPRVAAASPAIARLSRDVLRSLTMSQFKSIGIAAVSGLGLLAGWSYRGTPAQEPATPPATGAPPRRSEPKPTLNDPDRYRNYAQAWLGNMAPLVTINQGGVAFSSREAILYKDGTAKLYSLSEKAPVAPPLRHEQPIRAIAFFDPASLLVTLSDDEVRLWNGLTGELRQALPGQTISPLWSNLSDRSGRFLTLDLARKVVTVRDWTTLKDVATIRPAAEVSGAVLAPGGQTVATFHLGDGATVELWDVRSARAFATLRPPSAALRGIMIEADTKLDREALGEHDGAFWDVVRTLSPSAVRPKE